MTRVLIDGPLCASDLSELFKMPGVEVRFAQASDAEGPRPLPRAMVDDIQMIVCSYPPTNLDDMSQLKLVQLISTGYSQVFGLGLVERGIRACNSRGIFDAPIGEWNVAMMINLARDLPDMLRNQGQSRWHRAPRYEGEIRGSVVGLLGYGGIGRETARLSKALGMIIHVLSRSGVGPRTGVFNVDGVGDPQGVLPDRVFSANEVHQFLRGVDFLVLSLPLTPNSRGIIGEAELRALKPTAFLLNPSRGHLVQEEPLVRALREKWFAGAAIDTHYAYPLPPEHPLWSMPNVILTPHISGSSAGSFFAQRLAQIVYENLIRLVAGSPLLNELTVDQLLGK